MSNMSNEEIVARIQAGEQNLWGELWNNVERLVKWKANHAMIERQGYGGATFDDLVNSGFLTVVKAAETHKLGSAAFTTWLVINLQNTFSEVLGGRSKSRHFDPINYASSLDAPLGDDDGDSQFSDITPDPSGELPLELAEAKVLFNQTREALAEALAEIPTDQSQVLQHRYLEQKTVVQIGEDLGISVEEARSLERKGLWAMRQPRIAKKLRPLYEEFDFYGGTSLSAFRASGMSVQERYLIRQEKQSKLPQI